MTQNESRNLISTDTLHHMLCDLNGLSASPEKPGATMPTPQLHHLPDHVLMWHLSSAAVVIRCRSTAPLVRCAKSRGKPLRHSLSTTH